MQSSRVEIRKYLLWPRIIKALASTEPKMVNITMAPFGVEDKLESSQLLSQVGLDSAFAASVYLSGIVELEKAKIKIEKEKSQSKL